MFDFEIAYYLYKMSRIHKLFLNSKYKADAYYRAAIAVDAHNQFVYKMYQKNALRDIPFVGKKIEKCIIEIIETGNLKELQEYETEFKIRDDTLLMGYGLSDAILKKLWNIPLHSATDLFQDEYMKKCHSLLTKGELTKLERFFSDFRRLNGKYLYAYGNCLGKELMEYLNQIKGVHTSLFQGDMASTVEKIENIDIGFFFHGNWEHLINKLELNPRINIIQITAYSEITGLTKFGIPFRLIYLGNNAPETISSQMNYLNGKSIYGDLHTHTAWTDGIHTIEQMMSASEQFGYEYLAITDHTQSLHIAHGLSENEAISQIQKIREYNKQHRIKLLAGIEVDILANGDLDYSNEVLQQFDFVIAAIHSHLNQPGMVLEQRLNRALENPYVNILAHPTSRLLGRPGILFSDRAAYELEPEAIIALCKKYQVALEVNCFPERLDLSAEYAAFASNQGIKISLGTDAHSLAHLNNIEYGIRLLHKAKVNPDSVLNTYTYDKLIDFFAHQRPKTKLPQKTVVTAMKKDFWYYFHNNTDIIQGNKKVIGIDLTGNEDKESGWALMTGNTAECRRIKKDDVLIGTIMDYKPDIISIDSPLAYPNGRCCGKKDCSCSKYGIMRDSEKLLRHFGITVYPCLIDSMVPLTTRGMKLAKTLREMGYTVIESYPGVAQDILMIPRKGKTQEQFMHLKQGLTSFGISGDLLSNPDISHDEVDAITSAIVGYFYLNGQYVGLGNETEDYLIIPRIQDELIQKTIIIGLGGETGAGKTTVAEYLRFKYGLQYFRYSQIIEEIYHVQDKKELQQIGAAIAKNEDEQRSLTRRIIQRMKPGKSYVIDGLRHYEDYDELRNYFGKDFVFLYLECTYRSRYKRYNKLHMNQLTEADFEKINNHPAERNVAALQYQADFRIDNNKGFKDLRAQVNEILEQEIGGNL